MTYSQPQKNYEKSNVNTPKNNGGGAMKIGSLFSGYGGLDMAAQAVFPNAHPRMVR